MNKERRKMEPYSVPMLWTVNVSFRRHVMALSLGGYTESDGTNLNGNNSENYEEENGSW